MVSIKKKTQDNPRDVFQFVPLQDFSDESDIDWSKSIAEIDQQLYAKYKFRNPSQRITLYASIVTATWQPHAYVSYHILNYWKMKNSFI